jgi:hypothetical protein
MALRYYPKSKIKTNLIAENTQFLLDGNPYIGKYYETFDGKYFTGPNPVLGDNKELIKVDIYNSTPGLNFMPMTSNFRTTLASKNKTINRPTGKPTSYFPVPTEDEYRKGYFNRYFAKKINDKGYIIEISPIEYTQIKNGTTNYDISFYLTAEIFWKLTGNLNTTRISQYDIRKGVIDVNKDQVEKLNPTFIGIKEYIAEDYTKFYRP